MAEAESALQGGTEAGVWVGTRAVTGGRLQAIRCSVCFREQDTRQRQKNGHGRGREEKRGGKTTGRKLEEANSKNANLEEQNRFVTGMLRRVS